MNRIVFILLIFSGLMVWSCGCPDDEKTGDLGLAQETLSFLPYNGSETLVFENEQGNSLSFTAPRGQEENVDKLCYRTTCTEAKFGSPSSCEYYDAESRRFTYFTEGNAEVLDVLLFSDVYERGQALFYDALKVAYSSTSLSMNTHHLIDVRIDGTVDSTKINLADELKLQATLELNGRLFNEVLVFEEGENRGVYVKEGVGVIGFKNAQGTWLIKE